VGSQERDKTIDILRGIIMILMAIDHCFLTIYQTHYAETYNLLIPNYGSNSIFITRWLSNICAPGFALLMGISLSFYSKYNIDNQSVKIYLIKRGLVLIFLQQLLNLPSLFFDLKNIENIHLFTGSVLYSLGLSMILCSFFIKWNKPSQLLVGATIIFINYVIATYILQSSLSVTTQNTAHFFDNTIVHLLFTPGENKWVSVNYPVVPWLGVAIIGLGVGKYLMENKNKFLNKIWKIGLVLLVLFIVLRIMNWGDFNHIANTNDLINFLAIIKYPPSIAFILVTFGILFLLMALINKITSNSTLYKLMQPLLVFGKVPLFFYFAHYYLYIVISKFTNHHISLTKMYLLWLVGLIILFPICKSYDQFKKLKNPNSFWKLL
jgi:uncharacterized membrane protein